ncbi:tetratricopeptide repeat protein [bacterium]|nr:tetratricopeptide repeat protein [bacterium]
MKKFKLTLLILVFAGLCFASDEMLTTAQDFYLKGNYPKAIEIYETILKTEPNNYTALWKLSQVQADFGEFATSETEKEKLYAKSVSNAKKSTEVNPKGDEGFTYLAIANGRLGLFKGGEEKIKLSKYVKIYSEKALEINPDNDFALHVLARWNREVANLSWVKKMAVKVIYGGLPEASNEKAIELFQKAIKINPNYNNHHIELGKTYEELGRKKDAIKEYEKAISLTSQSEKEKKYHKRAVEFLKEIKN